MAKRFKQSEEQRKVTYKVNVRLKELAKNFGKSFVQTEYEEKLKSVPNLVLAKTRKGGISISTKSNLTDEEMEYISTVIPKGAKSLWKDLQKSDDKYIQEAITYTEGRSLRVRMRYVGIQSSAKNQITKSFKAILDALYKLQTQVEHEYNDTDLIPYDSSNDILMAEYDKLINDIDQIDTDLLEADTSNKTYANMLYIENLVAECNDRFTQWLMDKEEYLSHFNAATKVSSAVKNSYDQF